MERLARRYWNDMPWHKLERDEYFQDLERHKIGPMAIGILAELEDIAVFVLFSAFEAQVRQHVLNDVGEEVAGLRHPALKKAASRMVENIEEGSFYLNVLDLFKDLDHNLIEAVSQVRKYRNWVAHGRRPGEKPLAITPNVAFERLERFLRLIGASPSS